MTKKSPFWSKLVRINNKCDLLKQSNKEVAHTLLCNNTFSFSYFIDKLERMPKKKPSNENGWKIEDQNVKIALKFIT